MAVKDRAGLKQTLCAYGLKAWGRSSHGSPPRINRFGRRRVGYAPPWRQMIGECGVV